MKKKLCLVTGACGFVGSHMVELLLDHGYEVRATDLIGSERGVNFGILKERGIEVIPSDLTKPETLKDVCKDVEFVFHTAAFFAYEGSWKKLYDINVNGTRNLCQALVQYGNVKRFINWSSGSVYGLPRKEYKEIREGYHLNPCNNYGKSKMMQEQVVLEYLEYYKLPVTILRCVPIYGPRAMYGLADMWMTYSKFPALFLPHNFDSGFPYVHVADVCGAALFLAEEEKRNGEVYNIIDDPKYSTRHFFKTIAPLLNKKYVELPIDYRIYTIFFKSIHFFVKLFSKIIRCKFLIYLRETMLYATVDYRFSNSKLKKLDYKFKYSNREIGISETVQWFIEKGIIKVNKRNKM